MHAIIAGHICLDLMPQIPPGLTVEPGLLQEVGPMAVSPGGCVYNTGRALAALDMQVTLHSRIGSDAIGELLLSHLASTSLEAHLSRSTTAGTSYSIVLESTDRDRGFWHHAGACTEYDGSDLTAEDYGADALHVGYPSLLPALLLDDAAPLASLLQRGQQAGLLTSVDLAVVDPRSPAAQLSWRLILERTFAHCDIVSPSIDDLRSALHDQGPITVESVERYAEWILRSGAAVVNISVGERGSYIAVAHSRRLRSGGRILAALADTWAGYRSWIPAADVGAISTTKGAGDVHSGATLAAILAGEDPERVGRFAARMAADTIQGVPIDRCTQHSSTGRIQNH